MAEEKVTARSESVTTTHAAWGAGHPRILATSEHERYVHEINCDLIHIGSAADSDLQLTATDALHARILHGPADEYVLTMLGEGATSSGRHGILRTGAHFTAGPWQLIFVRDEFADHGRPYGGRIGGEAGHQRPQAPRPDYAREHPISSIARCALKRFEASGDQERSADLGRSVLAVATADRSDGSASSPLAVEVLNDETAGTYEANVAGTVVGGVPYNVVDDHRVALLAVSVLPEFRGRGVATELIHRVLDDVRARGMTVINYCPVVHRFVADHPNYADLVITDFPQTAVARRHS
ncbi:GNAT family N-acetyltransferase [Nocardioides sp. YIM 152315]|uniref:GNAT family N-acetyltransferase n=1 Tax=Nocardioides sp. YIM 152315 TaxID=3031760 RepID=UPI0023DC718F|nr:GNAT family N-acetyltransferase [Nocardioides sp. YIM 152315]MDF1604065.1 GNAT family N-acetyltransferase [Nocardioides sp. YIM 152315]